MLTRDELDALISEKRNSRSCSDDVVGQILQSSNSFVNEDAFEVLIFNQSFFQFTKLNKEMNKSTHTQIKGIEYRLISLIIVCKQLVVI